MAQTADDTRLARLARLARDRAEGALGVPGRSRPVERSRLGMYAAIGASIGSLPVPWLPDAFAKRVRGALVHDVTARHGLSLTREARDALAEPSGPEGPRSLVTQALRFVGLRAALRVFAPIAVVWPLRHALTTYLLGHLFDRYLELSRTERAVRIDVAEARRVRLAIDRAVLRSLTVVAATSDAPPLVDDQRGAADVLVDTMLAVAAGLPARGIHRVEAAFDELLLQTHD